jgi:signal transduction histidine kinase
MARRVSSARDRGNGVGTWVLRAGDPPRVAYAAGLHGDRRTGGAAAEHAAEERGQAEAAQAFAASIVESTETEAARPERDTLRYVASLAAAAAHELNNPLAVIMGYAQLLTDRVDAQGRGQIDEILEALSRVQEIVTRMKRVTRIELTAKTPYLPEMLDLIRSSEPGLPPH